MASDLLCEITDSNFESEVLQAELPVLVDFWAEWCGPCRMIGPSIEEIASEYEGKLKVGKANMDNAEQIATKFGIQAIPTLMLFKGGEMVESVTGALPKAQIVEKLVTPHV